MSDEEEDLFRREIADVQPLKADPKLLLRQTDSSQGPGLSYRRESAERSPEMDETRLPTTFVEPVGPEAVLSFRRSGIQSGVFRRLQRGEYPQEAVLDLHGYTVAEARRVLCTFMADCEALDVRSALISHGKGRGNPEGIPRIKSCLLRWLPLFPSVLAFHSAQKWHGGAGALYVLFRKTERAKDRTRERLRLGSGKPDA